MVIKRTHHIWPSQVASIPTVCLRLLLELREGIGSHHPCNVTPDLRGRQTLLSLNKQGSYYSMTSRRFSLSEQFHV